MKEFLSFVRSHLVLCILLAVLFAAMAVTGILLVREFRGSYQPTDTGTGEPLSTAVLTDAASDTTVQTEAVTEPPVPYFDEAGDAAYHPTAHTDDVFGSVCLNSTDHRIYTVYPDTDSEKFDDYCFTTVSSLITSSEIPQTAREGGMTVISVDYVLYLTDTVYSAVFTRKQTDTADAHVTQSVVVLTYNIETDTVYAPLDSYDMTAASEPLAEKIRVGYRSSLSSYGLPLDTLFLDEVCTPDPSSFVNIAVDEENMYFFTVYEKLEWSQLICAAVPFRAMEDYTWEAIEAKKQAEQQQTPPVITPVVIPTYDLSGAVPESAAVDNAYFEDAVFIGNSLIVGLQRSAPLKARYFASIGLNVSQVFTKPLIPMKSGNTFTVSEALATVEFSKVYLMFGINELGWGSITSFINYYAQIIDRIREVNPETIIYVQSILPINEEKWAKSRDYQSCINNVAVATFNQKILDMCVQKQVAFVNVAEVLTDETGNLFSDATGDGIHIGGIYSTRWVDYLKTHTVTVE